MNPISVPQSLSESNRAEVRKQFLAACSASGGGPPPDPEVFVAGFEEPERSELREELFRIRQDYSQLGGKGTRPELTGNTRRNESGPDGTVDHVPASDGTVDHVPSSDGTVDQMTPDGTVDHVPAPGTTVDHISAQDRTGDFAGNKSVPGLDSLLQRETESASRPKLPDSIAGYQIIRELGRGAMGVVYMARQRGLKRLVALKMILSGDVAGEHELNRFRAEANAVAQLQHPGIIQIYEVGEDNGRPFFSLEFVDGASLQQKIKDNPLLPREAAAMLQKMAEAMAYAHSRGVIHRDLKPANVLLTSSGEPKIGDFGLAKKLDDDESAMTRTGAVLGTPSYMSPEQASGLNQEVGPLSDVYSLGAVFYDLLTGRPPFRGTSVMDTLLQLRTREPVAPRELQPGIPRDLETICLKCLQKDRTKRYADAQALADDLKRYLNGEAILARPVSRFEKTWRWCRRNPFKAVTAALGIIGVIAYAVTVSLLLSMVNEQKDDAVKAKDSAQISEGKAIVAREIAEQNEERQRQTADLTLKQMVEMAGKFHDVMQSKRLSLDADPAIRKLRADAMKELRQSLAVVSKKIQATATQTYAEVLTAQLIGDMHKKLGQAEEAREMYEAGRARALIHLENHPDDDKAKSNLGTMIQRLGEVLLELKGDARAALARYEEAKKLHEQIERKQSEKGEPVWEIHRTIAHDDMHLGRAHIALGQAGQAQRFYQEALRYYEEWFKFEPDNIMAPAYVKEARMWLGITGYILNDAAQVDENFSAALKMGLDQMKRLPASLTFKVDQHEMESAYGDVLTKLGRYADAEKHLLESMKYLQMALKVRPDETAFQPLLAQTHERLAIVYNLLNKPAEAKENFQKAFPIRKTLYEVETGDLSRQTALVLALARTGDFAQAPRLATTIRPRMLKSPEFMLQLARTFALCAVGLPNERKKMVAEAIATLETATSDGYRDTVPLETDPELATLRDEPAFKELLAKIKARRDDKMTR